MHLRVWWGKKEKTIFWEGREAGSGIVFGSNGASYNSIFVRKDDGQMLDIPMEVVIKSEWVSHPDEDGEK